ncbi:uncharacterized protein [Paramisgurnus dabryanus]|uniref:uncharacterized protein n=1 Tax=Paramisgurnus dabryanus TaxID=90735 RepID=UPI003CCF127B
MVQTCTQTHTIDSIEESFKKTLLQGLNQTTVEKCDVILNFCPIASRAETDISAAVNQLDSLQVSKPAILVVLHHTFDPEKIIPDSSKTVNRETIQTVDCLFNEDVGLMQCQINKIAFEKVAEYLKSKNLTSYTCLKVSGGPFSMALSSKGSLSQKTLEDHAGLHPSSGTTTENRDDFSSYGSTDRLTHPEVVSQGQRVLQFLKKRRRVICPLSLFCIVVVGVFVVLYCTKII